MGKFLIIILLYILSIQTYAKDMQCDNHPIYCQIVKTHPKIDKVYAMRLSNTIYSVTTKYNIRPHIFTAILAQESMYKLNAMNCVKGVKFETNSEEQFFNKLIELQVCQDFGIAQINYKTARAFNFDVEKLTTDLEYSVEAGAIVLSDFKKRYYKNENDYWTRYNASNPEKREVYKRLVTRFIR